MEFRTTPSQLTTQNLARLARQTAQIGRAQREISSGIRVERASDDPVAMRRSLLQQDTISRLTTQIDALQQTRSRLTQAHTQLVDAQQILVKAREIALTGRQSLDTSEQEILAQEVDGLLNQLYSIANGSDEVGFLFGGTANVRPFTPGAGTQGRTPYQGTTQSQQTLLTGGAPWEALRTGQAIFQPQDRQGTVILGSTGLRSGAGIDTATGDRSVTIAHLATTYAPGSGLQGGLSAAAGNTILGAAGRHTVTLVDTSGTGAAGTVSLNGGTPVPFTSSDTDLVVTGPAGERIFVDTTSIVPGFSGVVSLTAEGTLSLDQGAQTTPLTFSDSQSVVDSRNGERVYLDTTQVTRTGVDQLEFPGTNDIFHALIALREDLRNSRGLGTAELSAAMGRRLGDLDRVSTHVLSEIGLQSVSLEQLERFETRAGDLKVAAEIQHSDTVSADIAASAIALQEGQLFQQFTLATIGQLMSTSILDYLR